jgi:hypothetical protein
LLRFQGLLAKVPSADWSHEETDDPLHADRRNFYKVEKWSRDGQRIEELLYAGNSLAKAQQILERFIKKRPRSRLTIRQRSRVLQEWPPPRRLTLNPCRSAPADTVDL